ncbi:MAG: antitoxin [bacterium]|nr:antitoxin [bacterium]
MRKIKLNKQEKEIEEALLKGEYVDIDKNEFKQIADTIASRKKDSVLNIRINSEDLKRLKKKAQHFDIRYQTFISELLHRIAQS